MGDFNFGWNRKKKKDETPEERQSRIWNWIMIIAASVWLYYEMFIKK